MYNLNKLQWAAPAPAQPEAAEETGVEGSGLLTPAGPPAAAGWTVTPLQDKLLVLGGHVKVGKVHATVVSAAATQQLFVCCSYGCATCSCRTCGISCATCSCKLQQLQYQHCRSPLEWSTLSLDAFAMHA